MSDDEEPTAIEKCPYCGSVNEFFGWSEMSSYDCRDCERHVEAQPSEEKPTTKEKCPYCGKMNQFPGWSEMFAYKCRGCGRGVEVLPKN